MMASLLTFALQICSVVFVSFPLFVSGQTGPSDVTVQQDDDATLTCSLGSPLGFAAWLDAGVIFADVNGIIPGGDAKYNNFAIVKTDTANGQYDLRVQGAQYEDQGEYVCQLGTEAQPSATLTVEVPATSLTIAVDSVEATPGGTVIVTEGVAVTLTCTALGAKPRVSLDWFKGSEPLTPDTETVPPSGEPTDTRSTHDPFIPGRSDDGGRIECRTSGHQTTQTENIMLNVRFAPVVTVEYDGEKIRCLSDANPLATSHQIILNGTDVLKSFTNSPGSADFKPDGCTEISCNATNTIATTTATFADNPVCPVFPDETTTEMPTTGYVEPTTKAAETEPSGTKKAPASQGLHPGIIAAIVVIALLALLGLCIGLFCCFKQRILCFGANKTSNGGSSPKKQPSVINADMIRNQPEVRQSVHKYDDEPKKPRVPRSNSGKPVPEKQALNQGAPPRANDHQGYPMDSHDGDDQRVRGQAGMNYADLEFQNREGEKNGHGKIHQSPEEPTQYASILV